MTDNTTEEPILIDKFTLGIDSPLMELILTENKLQKSPRFFVNSNPLQQSVSIHLPFFPEGITPNTDEYVYSENHLNVQLTHEQAKQLHTQLTTILDEFEQE